MKKRNIGEKLMVNFLSREKNTQGKVQCNESINLSSCEGFKVIDCSGIKIKKRGKILEKTWFDYITIFIIYFSYQK
jgi:hypothetical protein